MENIYLKKYLHFEDFIIFYIWITLDIYKKMNKNLPYLLKICLFKNNNILNI